MDAYSESRQRVFVAASVKFTTVKYILAVAKTKFATARIFRIKGPVKPLEPTRYSENTSHCSENTSPYSENTLS